MNSKLSQNFFQRKADLVAKDLIGKILVRKLGNKELKSRIIETEAYFNEKDPASRACKHGDLRETMKMKSGTLLIYGVHNNWLMNFVTDKEEEASAVLIRALEPLNFTANCSGPGLLTKALKIDKKLHKKDLINNKKIGVEEDINKDNLEIVSSFRIGIKKDLPEPFRFYLKDSKFVSKK
jgi:DNA-3-methyladenine glycosylase